MEWKKCKCGENGISYDHSIAETPFGRFVIAWKSWKEFDSYDTLESPFNDYLCVNEYSLEAAQKECERIYSEAINSEFKALKGEE